MSISGFEGLYVPSPYTTAHISLSAPISSLETASKALVYEIYLIHQLIDLRILIYRSLLLPLSYRETRNSQIHINISSLMRKNLYHKSQFG